MRGPRSWANHRGGPPPQRALEPRLASGSICRSTSADGAATGRDAERQLYPFSWSLADGSVRAAEESMPLAVGGCG